VTDDRMTAAICVQSHPSPVIDVADKSEERIHMQIRNKAITIRVSNDERNKLQNNANHYGLTLSAYLRMAGLLDSLEKVNGRMNEKTERDDVI